MTVRTYYYKFKRTKSIDPETVRLNKDPFGIFFLSFIETIPNFSIDCYLMEMCGESSRTHCGPLILSNHETDDQAPDNLCEKPYVVR